MSSRPGLEVAAELEDELVAAAAGVEAAMGAAGEVCAPPLDQALEPVSRRLLRTVASSPVCRLSAIGAAL